VLSTRESFIDATMIYLPTWFTAQYCSVLSGQSEMSGRNGSLHLFDQSFAQRKHYVYSEAARSKLSWIFTCPQIFIIIILKVREKNDADE